MSEDPKARKAPERPLIKCCQEFLRSMKDTTKIT